MNIRSSYAITPLRARQAVLSVLIGIFSIAALPAARPVAAAPLVVICADRLSLSGLYNTENGPLTPGELQGAVVALVSPGLPDHKAGGPYANLYATLSAGDVIDTANMHDGLLQRELFVGASPGAAELIRFGDASTLRARLRLRALIQRLRSGRGSGARAPGILLVGVLPASDADPGLPNESWSDLTPIVWLSCGAGGSDAAQQPTLASGTTQTPGLIALRDIAPTILASLGLPIPPSMSGEGAHVVLIGAHARIGRDELLRDMASLASINQRALAPFGWIYGSLCGVVLVLSLLALGRRNQESGALRYALRWVLSVPLALLIVPVFGCRDTSGYLAVIALIALLYALIPRLGIIYAVTCGVLFVDALFLGTALVSRALLSGYWLSGIRFYGIGNEYMGLLIGMALLLPVFAGDLLPKNAFRSATPAFCASAVWPALWYLAVLVVLAYPQFGAKAGGAVSACAAFIPALRAARTKRAPGCLSWLIGVAAGFAAIFAFVLIAHRLGARPTHIQSAVLALLSGKSSAIAHLALRKMKMAVRIALAPGVLAAVAGIAIAFLVARARPAGKQIAVFLSQPDRGPLLRALQSGAWGMLACVLFNDSGVVAALLLFGVLAASALHEQLGGAGAHADPGA